MKMSLVELRSAADKFFRRHLEGGKWNALTEERKQSALLTAEADVALYLDAISVNAEDEREMSALFEQALHLGITPPRHETDTTARLVSEEVTGVGRRTWEYPDSTQPAEPEKPEFSPRVLRILETIKRNRPIRFGRG